jgi:5-methyltetrahydropteroyltriglutamate--homocysteine methyltransferase
VIITTTIGAYPKPAYVPISDWFSSPVGEESVDYTSAFAREMAQAGSEREALFSRAAGEVIDDQIAAGIGIVTDGEVRRENYVHYQCRHFSGFDFENLSTATIRGVTQARLPTVRGEVHHLGTSPLVHDYRVAQSLSSKPVKVTIPGPMTIIDTTVDSCYHDDVALGADLAAAINAQALDLVEAGCLHIQVDEPVMARKPGIALDYGIEHLEHCFAGVPASVTRVVHCCCGYPEHLDQHDYPKADPDSYLAVAEALDSIAVDAVSIEDAHRHNDLAALLPRFTGTTVILGVLGVARSTLEAVDDIEERLMQALKHLPPERLMAAPDCGLGFLGRDLARRKLAVMCEAVGRVNSRLG